MSDKLFTHMLNNVTSGDCIDVMRQAEVSSTLILTPTITALPSNVCAF
jgi:hypothetical protein